MTLPVAIRLPKYMREAKTYEDFKQLMFKKKERYPIGLEIIEYWDAQPEVYKEMCPNPVKIKNGAK